MRGDSIKIKVALVRVALLGGLLSLGGGLPGGALRLEAADTAGIHTAAHPETALGEHPRTTPKEKPGAPITDLSKATGYTARNGPHRVKGSVPHDPWARPPVYGKLHYGHPLPRYARPLPKKARAPWLHRKARPSKGGANPALLRGRKEAEEKQKKLKVFINNPLGKVISIEKKEGEFSGSDRR